MVRYVHHRLISVVEAGVAVAVTAPVAFAVRGLPRVEGDHMLLVLSLACLSACLGMPAVPTRLTWLEGEKRDFENAVPLADPEAVLPTPRESMRRSFQRGFVAFVALPSLIPGLFWGPWATGLMFLFVSERIGKGVSVYFWERRHGVLLWYGGVEEQPLEKGQFLYSSPRSATPPVTSLT